MIKIKYKYFYDNEALGKVGVIIVPNNELFMGASTDYQIIIKL